MAVKLTLIKNLKTSEPTIFQLLNTFVFGDKTVDPYDSSKVYKAGDIITVTDSTTGKLTVLQCIDDNVTGPFDITKWEKSSIADVAMSGGTKMISFSSTKPTDRSNILWFKPQNTRTIDIPVSFLQ